LPTSKDVPSSLVQLRNAVWTGDTRDTRPISGIRARRLAGAPDFSVLQTAFVLQRRSRCYGQN
jgi:hypothetical protein